MCCHGRETVGGTPTQQRAQTAYRQGSEGYTPARLCAPAVRNQGKEEEGDPPKPQCMQHTREGGREVDTPTGQQDTPMRSPGEEEGGNPSELQHAHPAQVMQDREGGGADLNDRMKGGQPSSSARAQHTRPAHAPSTRQTGVGRGDPRTKGGGGGAPPKHERTPFVLGLIREMGGSPQDLQRPHTSRRSGVEGSGEDGRESAGVG